MAGPANGQGAVVRRRFWIIVLAMLVVLGAVGLVTHVIVRHRQADRIYATPTLPLAVTDANDAAAKAAASAKSAQRSAARAKAAAANKAASR
jgi:hypothetical protein